MWFLSEFWADEQVGSVTDVTDVYLNWVRSYPPNNPVPTVNLRATPAFR